MFSKFSFTIVAVTVFILLIIIDNNDGANAKHIYIRYKRSIERESDPIVPLKESTVIAQGDDENDVHRTVKDFSNEIATNEKGGKDFFEFDYNPQKDLFKFSGHVPQLFAGNRHLQMFERKSPSVLILFFSIQTIKNIFSLHRTEMMQQMLANTQQMFQNFPMATFNNDYPENYNGTTESEVIIGGRRFRKKERVINQTGEGTQLSIVSTIYEPIEDDNEVTTMTPLNREGVTEGPVISY